MTATCQAASSGSAPGGAVTVTKPTGTVDNDLLVAISWQDPDGNPASQTATGWTQEGSTQDVALVGSTKVWRKTAASEGASWSFGGDIGASGLVAVLRIDGHDPSTPIDVTATFSTGAASTSQVAPSISPSGTDSLLICGAYTLVAGTDTNSYTPPSGMTEQADFQVSGGWIVASVATLGLSASGATGTKTFTCTISKVWLTVSLAVKSEPTGPPPPDDPHGFLRKVPRGRRVRR